MTSLYWISPQHIKSKFAIIPCCFGDFSLFSLTTLAAFSFSLTGSAGAVSPPIAPTTGFTGLLPDGDMEWLADSGTTEEPACRDLRVERGDCVLRDTLFSPEAAETPRPEVEGWVRGTSAGPIVGTGWACGLTPATVCGWLGTVEVRGREELLPRVGVSWGVEAELPLVPFIMASPSAAGGAG